MRTPLSRRAVGAGALAVALAGSALALPALAADPVLLSQGRPVAASSVENPDYTPPTAAVDGDLGTRWSSAASDDEWISVDLGAVATIDRVELAWEAAYGTAYTIQVSDDGSAWSDAASVTGGDGGTDVVAVGASGRYLRVQGVDRATGYGYSLWELQVFGTPGTGPTPEPTPDPTGGPTPEPAPDPTGGPGTCDDADAALDRPVTASSVEGPWAAANAVDGDPGTRWSSAASDDEWIQVDLGAVTDLCGVDLTWETAYGRGYEIRVSDDGTTWSTAATVTDGDGGHDAVALDAAGRYVRVQGVERATGWGYSLFELEVHVGEATDPTDPTDPVETGGDLGPNVHVYDATTPTQQIQAELDAAFTQQESDQFGEGRHQFLFKPGTYPVHAHVGFYTSVSGAGRDPDDVDVTGGVWADAQWFNGNATQNFWRSVENLKITPSTGDDRWAVSQAAPMRRVHVDGALSLHSSWYGWASGGFIADSKIEGQVNGYTQQQWYTRDSNLAGGWDGTLWNMTYSGVLNAPPTTFPDPAVTTLDTTGVIREKPYLYWDEQADDWAVLVPELRDGTRGTTWENGSTPGESIPLDDFYVATPDDAEWKINAALDQRLHVLFTPGVYRLADTIEVTKPDTVVLGLGYATIIPTAGQTAMTVADVDGVKIAALLFDAGETESPAMLQVGPDGSSADHADDPISIHDVFVRVGGAVAGKVESGIVVNADDTIIDHIWSWRGDHGEGIGWDVNTADHGLVVDGDDVSGYGLFVEHYQKENTLWNGERGRTIFYQNELPYDPPSVEEWTHDGIRGYAAYKVADHVREHEAWGLGSYCVFTTDASITVDNGFEVPDTPGVRMHSLLTVSLGGAGTYAHVINGVGPQASGTETIPAKVPFYSNGTTG
ncbi:F5/8 type C domain-containing protein [Isoptericola jiangsuensis]|uniref:F5/8 type C domain-containing protein n=1 Tax=Isoptericola jiangsuensis TaxID=548579 RepID=A0A2A9F255_9MICO|nr:discoidin domain-containing protein [Isoptericola jiangsuensis]PFG44535.1 F5/8 type C domain-containing protein [Isoptericola jiangsuensis]